MFQQKSTILQNAISLIKFLFPGHSGNQMNNYNTFQLVFCFVSHLFLNCMCSVLLLFKFGNIGKKWPPEMSTEKSVLKSFAKLTGKYLRQSRPATL